MQGVVAGVWGHCWSRGGQAGCLSHRADRAGCLSHRADRAGCLSHRADRAGCLSYRAKDRSGDLSHLSYRRLPLLRAVALMLWLLSLSGCVILEKPVEYRNTSVGIVQSEVPIDPDDPETKMRRQYFHVATDALKRAGISFHVLKDQDVAGGRLAEHAIAIFPYTHSMDVAQQLAVVGYMRAGGKVILCDRIPPGVARVLGVHVRGSEFDTPENRFDRCRLVPPGIVGAPEWFVQHSWHIHLVGPSGHGARMLYEWCDAQGNPTGVPAVILSDRGAYVSHILTKPDRESKSGLLVSLIAHFIPEIWPRAANRALTDVGRVGQAETIAALRGLVAAAQHEGRAKGADKTLDEAETVIASANKALEKGEFAKAIGLSGAGQRLVAGAYVRTLPTRDCELRGVWLANPRGVAGWGWDRTVRELSRLGFNAIFALMAWGGEVAYDSEYLPLCEAAAGEDQLAVCLAACKKYGVECHVWKINYNLGRCAPQIMAKFRRQERLQRDRFGKTVPWLCPSDPRNLELERTIMLEIVRKYDVDGIHFDYIRYPNADCCYCPRCRRGFEQEVGVRFRWWPGQLRGGPLYGRFRIWRQDHITRLVKTVSRQVREFKPHVEISAAVFPNYDSDRYVVGQDWRKWVKQDWLDFVCPMDYFPGGEHLERRVKRQVELVGGEAPLYIGIGSWQLQDVTDLAEQIGLVRRLGADGYVLFHYDDLTLIEEWMPLLRQGPTAINAVTPHSGPDTGIRITGGVEAKGEGLVASVGEAITVAGWVAPESGIRQARLELHSLQGERVSRGRRLYPDRRRIVTFSPPPGEYRPAIVGRVGEKPFVRRGRIVRVEAKGNDRLTPRDGRLTAG